MSMLPITQYCGMAGQLAVGMGAGRAAAMSTAFHAKCARIGGLPTAETTEREWIFQRAWALLSDSEKEEVRQWKLPDDVTVGLVDLKYADAEKEIALGLDDFGYHTDDPAQALTWGHMDYGWVEPLFAAADRETHTGKVAFVEDIKKTVWTTKEGPASLQLHAYGRAYALKHGCSHYVTGIWLATEGRHMWSNEWVELDSARGEEIWDRIYHAAKNTGEFATGDHCDGCWQRLHCSQHVLPAALADTYLAPIAEGHMPTDEEAAEMLIRAKRGIEVLEKAVENLGQWVKHGKLTVQTDTKRWAAIETKGKEKLDTAAVERALGRPLDEFMVRGVGYSQLRWVNRKGVL